MVPSSLQVQSASARLLSTSRPLVQDDASLSSGSFSLLLHWFCYIGLVGLVFIARNMLVCNWMLFTESGELWLGRARWFLNNRGTVCYGIIWERFYQRRKGERKKDEFKSRKLNVKLDILEYISCSSIKLDILEWISCLNIWRLIIVILLVSFCTF